MDALANLPPTALFAMGLGLAVLFGVRYLGLMQGEKSVGGSNPAAAQVAAVIVDPSALNRLTDQAGRLCAVLEELVDQAKDKIRVDGLMASELDRIREELRIQREISRGRG